MTGQRLTPKSGPASAIVWFRYDLRIADNPALEAALRHGGTVVPLFVWAPEEESPWAPGAASRWWLHHSLERLSRSLQALGSPLLIRRGESLNEILSVLKASGAQAVFWNRTYEPSLVARDRRVKEELRRDGYTAESFNGTLLHEPWQIQNKAGKPFQVFTAYWRTCLARPEPEPPANGPAGLRPVSGVDSCSVEDLELLPRFDWAAGLRASWEPGETGAWKELERFLEVGSRDYPAARDLPHVTGTSRLSAHLHFGEISPRQIWHAFRERTSAKDPRWREHAFLTELGWREFGRHLLYHYPHMTLKPLREAFERFPWRKHPAALESWQRGQTGVPLVDAGMRQLWTTGWMHNRVRMVVASFLVKNLLIPWQEGSRWFWDTLVDADLGNNTLGWQWVTGCGADAAPYFRVFNPVTQGRKFDPTGAYVREWVPELRKLPDAWVHEPHRAPTNVLGEVGFRPGVDYPEPIVSLFASRNAALEAYRSIQADNGGG